MSIQLPGYVSLYSVNSLLYSSLVDVVALFLLRSSTRMSSSNKKNEYKLKERDFKAPCRASFELKQPG